MRTALLLTLVLLLTACSSTKPPETASATPAPRPATPAPPPPVAQSQPTLKMDGLEGGAYEVAYDPAVITEADLKQALLFAPETAVAPYWFNPQNAGWGPGKQLLAPSLDLCPDTIKGYQEPCGRDKEHGAENARIGLAEGEREIAALKGMTIEPELEPIRAVFLKELTDSQALNRMVSAYLSDFDLAALRRSKMQLLPDSRCNDILDRATGLERAPLFDLIHHDFFNCMNGAIQDRFPRYPIAAWKAFATSRDLVEHSKPLNEDRD